MLHPIFAELRSKVKNVVDIGVFSGTPWLYDAFPEAVFFLFDPLPVETLETKPNRFEYIQTALSDKQGVQEMDVAGPKSSLNDRTRLTRSRKSSRLTVPTMTFDAFMESRRSTNDSLSDLLIKIDTEGHELNVLRGMDKTIEGDDVLGFVVEASVKKRFASGYRFSDLIAAFAEKGFQFYDFLPRDYLAQNQYDIILLPETHAAFSTANRQWNDHPPSVRP